jgi:hypothetical protein
LGLEEKWSTLSSILEPLDDFSVTTPEKLIYIDKTRILFDAAVGGDVELGIVAMMTITGSLVDSSYTPLKMLLAIGVDPDLPATSGSFYRRRPSHLCGMLGNQKAARCIFPCRPDMTALTENAKCTPLVAAQISYQVTVLADVMIRTNRRIKVCARFGPCRACTNAFPSTDYRHVNTRKKDGELSG